MLNLFFLGDISLNDNYITYFKNKINPFSNLEPILKQSDYVIGNLECMADGNGENELKKPRLVTTVETLNYIKNLNLSVACLAHNHVYDHLEEGFINTTRFLKENNIKYLGASIESRNYDSPVILEKNRIKVGILNYVTNDTNPNLPSDTKVFLNIFEINKVINDIIKLKPNVNHIVLILHWGGRVEGGLYPDWHQPKLARKLIDAGADLIIGHHSHTIQPYEIYKGKCIFYSLGNFCFSDYTFNEELNPMPLRRRISTIVSVNFGIETYEMELSFFYNNGASFKETKNYHNKVKFRNRFFKYFLRYKLIWQFYYFHLKYILPLILFLQRNDISFGKKIIRLSRSVKRRYMKVFTFNKLSYEKN